MKRRLSEGIVTSLRLVGYWAVAAALQSVVAYVAVCFPNVFGFPGGAAFNDLDSYFRWAQSILAGRVPYRDFVVEYPPLALPFFVAPALVSGRFFRAYTLMFAIEMIVVNALLLWLVAREIKRVEGIGRVASGLAWYSAFFLILCPLSVIRFDLVPTLAAFAAACRLARGRPAAGGIMAGLGTLAKITPGLVVLPVVMAPGSWRPRAKAIAAFGLVVAAGVLGWYQLGGEKVIASVRYHSERGIEVGSFYSSAFIAARLVADYQCHLAFDHLSYNIVGTGTATVAKLSPLAQAACLVLVAWRSRRSTPDEWVRLAGAALLAYVIPSKVLSPQYLLWLIPFVTASGTRRQRLLFLICCALTTALYPWNFVSLCYFRAIPELMLLARNAGLVWLFLSMLGTRRIIQ